MIIMKVKKKAAIMIALSVGVVTLAGAALASYGTMSGYDVAKTALKRLMSNENYTAELTADFIVDGESIDYCKMIELYDRDGDAKLNRTIYTKGRTDDSATKSYRYFQDGTEISNFVANDGYERTNVYRNANVALNDFDIINTMDEDEKTTANKVIRFVELVCDTMIGDLKNNIVYVSGDDYSSTYEINLDAIQIPEFANAGLSAMFSSMCSQEYLYGDEPYIIMGTDPIVKSVSLVFTVDNEGRLTNSTGNVTLYGNEHETSVDISLKMYDYGTTVPQRVDISSFKNVEYYD